MRNYWFGTSYRLGSLLVASIDLAYTLIHVTTGLIVILFPELFLNPSVNSSFLFPSNYLPDASFFAESLTMGLVSLICVFAAETALVVLLLCAILKRDPVKCQLWVQIRLVLLAIGTFGFVFEMTLMPFISYWYIASLTLILFLAVVYRAYSILIVRLFRADLLMVLHGYDLGLKIYASPNKI